MGWVCGALSRILHLWVIHGMVKGETQHVFPGGGVHQSFHVC